jgi:hypothetical protein
MPRAKSTGRKKWCRSLTEEDKDRLAKELLEESQRDGEAEDATYYTGGTHGK